MRAFVAFPLPPPIPDEAAALIERLRKGLAFGGPEVKWVEPGTMHLTLKFLGSHLPNDPESLMILRGAIEKGLEGARPVELKWGLATALPSLREPRVLILDLVREARRDLGRIAKSIEQAVAPLGIERERDPYYPHLTLGHLKNRQGTKIIVDTLKANGRFAPSEATLDRVVLYRSVLKKAGPVHTPITEWTLTNEASDQPMPPAPDIAPEG